MKPLLTDSVESPAPKTFLLAYVWLNPVTLSRPNNPLVVGAPLDEVLPSYTLVVLAAVMVKVAGEIVNVPLV